MKNEIKSYCRLCGKEKELIRPIKNMSFYGEEICLNKKCKSNLKEVFGE